MRAYGSLGIGLPDLRQLPFAWITFQGDAASATSVASSYNVSALQDNGVGDYTVVFGAPCAATPYSYIYCGVNSAIAGEPTCRLVTSPTGFNTQSSTRLNARSVNDTLFDPPLLSVLFFGDV